MSDPRPLVSIVTATLNAADSLPVTAASVFEQRYRSLEYIVVDGGSTDGTVELLTSGDVPTARWISEPDDGIYDALNKGAGLARGKWLYFLGAGDRLHDRHVLDCMFERPLVETLLYGDVILDQTGRRYGGRFSRRTIALRNICQQAILYPRALFERFGPFETRYRVWADWAFNLRCFAARNLYPQHRDLIVATYASDGFSSRRVDSHFLSDAEQLIRPLGEAAWWLYRAKHAARRALGKPPLVNQAAA